MLKKKKEKKVKKSDPLESHHFVKKHLESEDDTDLQEKKLDEVSEHLVEIYKNKDGSLPDMKHFEKTKSQRSVRAFFTLLFACIFFGAVLLGGFFYLGPKQNFSKDGVTVEIVSEDALVSGELVRYRIRYRNSETVPITKVKLVVRYPAGFQFSESSIPASNDTNTEWDLGTLAAGESGFFDLYGRVYGDFGSEESIRVFLNYTPANFSSEFQSVSLAKLVFDESPVALNISGPTSVLKGQMASLVFTVTSREATSSLQNLSLVVEPGDGLVKKNSNPESDNFGTWTWSIPNLSEEKNITVGSVFSPSSDAKEYTFKAKIVGSPKGIGGDQKTFVFAEKEYTVSFEESEILGQFSINGATDSLSVTPGETLSILAAVKNNLPSNITNVRASVILDAPSFQDKSILNYAKIEDKNNNSIQGQQVGTDIRRGVVAWDKSHISSLGILVPNAEVPFAFRLPLKSREESPLQSFKEHRMTATFEVQYEKDGAKQTFVSVPIDITINSDVQFDATLQKQVVDKKDTFDVSWDISSMPHEIQNIEISAQIFGDITWKGEKLSASLGKIEFDAKEKKLLWKIDKLTPSMATEKATFSFVRKSFNSTQTQLISKVQIKGKDMVTGKDILLVEKEIPNSP